MRRCCFCSWESWSFPITLWEADLQSLCSSYGNFIILCDLPQKTHIIKLIPEQKLVKNCCICTCICKRHFWTSCLINNKNIDISFSFSFWSSNDARSNPWSVGHSRVSSQRRPAGRHPRHHPDRPAQTGRALQPRCGSVSSHPEQTRQETVRRHQGWGENETSHLSFWMLLVIQICRIAVKIPIALVNNICVIVWESETDVLLFEKLLWKLFTPWSRVTPGGHHCLCQILTWFFF